MKGQLPALWARSPERPAIHGVLYPSPDTRAPMHRSQVRWSAGRRGPKGIVIAPQARTRYDAERLLAVGVYEGLTRSLRCADPG